MLKIAGIAAYTEIAMQKVITRKQRMEAGYEKGNYIRHI